MNTKVSITQISENEKSFSKKFGKVSILLIESYVTVIFCTILKMFQSNIRGKPNKNSTARMG